MTDDTTPAGLRVCVVGDGLAAGVGDAKALGWTGRVAARSTPVPAGGLTVFALGVPGEGTAGLLDRWQVETARRFDDAADNRLVVGLGSADLDAGTSLARSRLNLANVLDDAMSRSIRTFVVGPVPGLDAARNDQVAALSNAFGDVCDRRDVPFVDCYGPLSTQNDWFADLAGGDGVNPGQAGHGLVAWLVLHGGWKAWLGLPES